MKRKLLAYFLVIAMLLAMFPVQAIAADEGTVLAQVTDVTVGADDPWVYEFTLDTTGILNVTIGDCSPGWEYKIYYPDGTSTLWCTANSWSVGADADFEITQTGTYSIALYAYNSKTWSNVDGTVSATLTFTSSEITVEKAEYIVSDTVLSVGENSLTLDTGAVTTIYAFSPDETGTYTFTASDASALVGNWGMGSFNIVDNTAEKTSTLEWTCTDVGQTIMVGISGVESVTLNVEKTADYTPVVIEWTVYENTELANWADYEIDTTTFTKISVTDSTADVIVKCEDGLYRYGSADGRVVVSNLLNNGYINFSTALSSGDSMRVAYTETSGTDMREAMQEYCDAGKYYPLTDELIWMLTELGNDRGWYDPDMENGYYLFGTKTVDAETAFLAFCGTVGTACEHTWVDADCENAKTCSACGTTEGDALGHSWTDADCDTPKTCSACGATDGDALGHSWTDADCDTPKTCSVCGATDGDALGHSYVDGTCERCGETILVPSVEIFENIGCTAGDYFAVAVALWNNPGVASATFTFEYDTDVLEFVGIDTIILSGDDYSYSAADGVATVTVNTAADLTGDGDLFYLIFNAVSCGSSAIDVEITTAANAAGEKVTFTAIDGSVNADHNYVSNTCTYCGELETAVVFQLKTDGTAIRMLSFVGDLSEYASVTFNVTVGDKTTELTCTNAYKSVLAGGKQLTASSVFGEDAEYFVMYTLTGIDESYAPLEMTVSVTWTAVDGTKTTSEPRTVTFELVA